MAQLCYWGLGAYEGALKLVGIEGTLNFEYYLCFNESLPLVMIFLYKDNCTLIPSNSRVYTIQFSKQWIEANDIDVLNWPSKSPN